MITTKTNTSIERLRTLYSVLAGIPDERVLLNRFAVELGAYYREKINGDELLHNCGTVACAGGWAAVYPEFTSQGLILRGGLPRYQDVGGFEALALFFQIPWSDARDLFGTYTPNRKLAAELMDQHGYLKPGISHKRLALHRIRTYLLQKRAITPKRSRELAKLEAKV